MRKRPTIKEINSRGWTRGWHAEQLQNRAKNARKTMAQQWREEHKDCSAFNVPAIAVKHIGEFQTLYRFIDQSEATVGIR